MREVKYELNKFPSYGNVITIKKSLFENGEGFLKRNYNFESYTPPTKVFLANKLPKIHKVWSAVAKSRYWKVNSVYQKF